MCIVVFRERHYEILQPSSHQISLYLGGGKKVSGVGWDGMGGGEVIQTGNNNLLYLIILYFILESAGHQQQQLKHHMKYIYIYFRLFFFLKLS